VVVGTVVVVVGTVVVVVGTVVVVVGTGVLVVWTAVVTVTAGVGSTLATASLLPKEGPEPRAPTRTTSARRPIVAPPSRPHRLSLLATLAA